MVTVPARPLEVPARGVWRALAAPGARAVGGAELNASRIRDQLSIPARGATDEEVLLRLRRLQSGYEYSLSVSLTYTFGSIFSSIVNPRFGQMKV